MTRKYNIVHKILHKLINIKYETKGNDHKNPC